MRCPSAAMRCSQSGWASAHWPVTKNVAGTSAALSASRMPGVKATS